MTLHIPDELSDDFVGTEAANDHWPDPEPLPSGLPPVAPFDADLLPAAFRGWVMDVANRMQCPPDFPAVGVMVSAASIIGRQVAIRPKRKDDWMVTPNLWGAVVGRPGIMKSPALSEATKPVHAMEAQAAEEYREAMKGAKVEASLAKIDRDLKASEARKLLKAGKGDAARRLIEDDTEEKRKIARRRYIVNDSTVEALGEILNANPNGVLVFRDELTGFMRVMDKEGREGDRQFYLEAWNGNGRYTYDRIGRGTVDIEAATVSILGGMQPGPLAEYLSGAVHGGKADDGLMQRFQVVVYPDPNHGWENVDEWPDKDAKAHAVNAFTRISKLDEGVLAVDKDHGEIPFLRFDVDGQIAFEKWRFRHEGRLRTDDLHHAVESHFAKYRSLVPSLALICHLVDGGTASVGVEAVSRAIRWAKYLESHARRIYATVTHSETETAKLLAVKVLDRSLSNPFSSKDVWRPGWGGLSDRKAAQSAIDALTELDWLAPEIVATKGRSATRYRINPKVCRLEV